MYRIDLRMIALNFHAFLPVTIIQTLNPFFPSREKWTFYQVFVKLDPIDNGRMYTHVSQWSILADALSISNRVYVASHK